ncbi:MAG: PAS domain S-box protein [Elusimicrobiota bacterium]|nr:PAS domain S-box protein [Elusimicrobiota bacterium]
MDAKPDAKQATFARRIFQRARGRRRAPRRFGRAPSAPVPASEDRLLSSGPRFVAALLLPPLAALLQAAFWPGYTWALFYPAAFFGSWLGGTAVGLLATFEAAAMGWYFFTPRERGLWPLDYQILIPTVIFISMGVIFTFMHDRLRRLTRGWEAATAELSELFEQASEGIFVADLAGRYTDVNAAGCRMLGRSREELLGKTIMDLLPAEQLGKLDESRRCLQETGGAHTGEWELKRGDGSLVPVEVSAKTLRDGRWHAFVRDISERKRSEEALRKLGEERRRDEFRMALESAASAMVLVDGEGRVVLVNAEADKLFGYPSGELAGRLVEVLVPERFRAAHPARREGFFHGGAGKRDMGAGRVVQAVRMNGSEFPADIGLTRVTLEDKTFVVASVIDVTERMASEQRLLDSEERFRLLVQNVKDYAIFMHDADGKVTVWNEGAERILGYGAGEILGRSFTAFYPPEDLAAGKDRTDLKSAVERGSLQVEEWRVRKDGTRFMANIVISPVTGRDGKLVGYAKVIRDLTEIKSAEAALKGTAARLRRTAEELEGFAYTASHDLRSPLRAIQGYAHFAQERLKGKADPESLGMLERISAATVRLDRLIRDVLSYSAIARAEITLSPVDLDKIVEHVLNLYPDLKAVRLEVKRPLGAVMGQESLMLQIVSNLLVNAVKFVPAGRAPAIEVRTETAAPGTLRLIVEDNGPGIPRVHWERIFQPFQRLPGTRATPGSGIGLAIVKRAVERLGGTIRVESEPCRGTRFIIELSETGHGA